MQLKRLLLSSALIAAVAVPVYAVPQPAAAISTPTASAISGSISVGDFLVRMARVLDPRLPENTTVEEAVASLKESGVAVPEDLDPERVLTEGDVVRFASAAGLRLKTLDPDQMFPAEKVDALGHLLGGIQPPEDRSPGRSDGGSILGDEGDQGPGTGSPRAREKRKKKKVFDSPFCVENPGHPQCP